MISYAEPLAARIVHKNAHLAASIACLNWSNFVCQLAWLSCYLVNVLEIFSPMISGVNGLIT